MVREMYMHIRLFDLLFKRQTEWLLIEHKSKIIEEII